MTDERAESEFETREARDSYNFFTPVNNPTLKRSRPIAVIAAGMLSGALLGGYFGQEPGWTAIGALAGFLVSWKICEVWSGEVDLFPRFPYAWLSLGLAGTGYVLEAWLLGWLILPRFFLGENVVREAVYLVFPSAVILWALTIVPARGAALQALKQIAAGIRPESDRKLAALGLKLSRAFTIALLAFIICLAVEMAG